MNDESLIFLTAKVASLNQLRPVENTVGCNLKGFMREEWAYRKRNFESPGVATQPYMVSGEKVMLLGEDDKRVEKMESVVFQNFQNLESHYLSANAVKKLLRGQRRINTHLMRLFCHQPSLLKSLLSNAKLI